MGLNETRTPGPGPQQPTTVRVEIGELALDGFGHGTDPDLVSAAFQTELNRLVQTHGVPLSEDGTDRALDVLTQLAPLPRTASPARIGQALAQAVHAGLSGRGREPGAADHLRGRR
ncbi:hypothetical protein ACIBLA_13935 [Streptomyces sp. NPDC050433]|uniref:hypothetical protein n=1 Tax=Streptomyces sp. NPDC050433 TaxID=3365615 RepID=UPI00379D6117